MRELLVITLMLVLGVARAAEGVPSPEVSLQQYLALYTATDDADVSTEALISFVAKLEGKRRTQSEKAFINNLFIKTHQRFLKEYREYTSFSGLLDNGTYNCLTATALYALLLNRFDIDFRIVETNYHIFLLVQTGAGDVLLETTDPVNGFVDAKEAIDKRIAAYRDTNVQQRKDRQYHSFSFDAFHEVSLDQMLGLLYYNQAVKAFNHQQLVTTVSLLDKAYALYPSPRMDEFSRIVLLSVVESGLDQPEKERCAKQLQAIRKRGAPVMARAAQ